MVNIIKKLNLHKNVILLGRNDNIPQVMNGLDLHVLSSCYGEGFPNVIAEAMACGTPCIATDVGDAAFIIGKTGWVVPPKNPIKLSGAIENALFEFGSKKWDNKCVKSRLTIKEKFSINKMLNSYNNVWRKVYKKNY